MPNGRPLPPQDLEAERAVLGGFMLSRPSIDEIQPILSPDQFYAHPHRLLCEAIYSLNDKNKEIDTIAICKELERREWLAEIGGLEYVVQCMESVPHAGHSAYYAGLVKDAWKRRVVIDSCTDTMHAAYGKTVDTDELVAKHDTATQRLLETAVSCSDIKPIGTILVEALVNDAERLDRHAIPTGFEQLDDICGGLVPSNLVVLAGRASMGKTAFLLSVLNNVSTAMHPVLVFSLEMSSLELGERMLAMNSGVPMYRLRTGNMDDIDHQRIGESQENLHVLPLYVDDRMDGTVAQIGAVARRMKRSHQIEVIAVDYLQLVSPESAQTREQEVAGITRRLKVLAKNIQLPIILLAQLSRAVEQRENKRPRLSDLRESGAIEQDADQVWFVHRPEYFDPNDHPGEAEIIVAKNRNGPISSPNRQVWLQFQAESMRFVQPASPVGPVQGVLYGRNDDW